MDALIEEVASALRGARRVVALTGAGVSAESGIATFREAVHGAAAGAGTMAALWAEFDPMKLATPEAFAADPAAVSRWYDRRRLGCLAAAPNPGHVALAELERLLESRGGRLTLLTQNVDRLHQKAGSRNVVELHGNIITWRCTRTGRQVEPPAEGFAEFPAKSPFDAEGLLRPDVVWFGEMLPPAALAAAEEALSACDAFVSIGTSSVVYPAAGFVRMAAMRGAATAEVNAEETAASGIVDVTVRGRSGDVLPKVVGLLAGRETRGG
ncbi:MAG TPA: NAD-dependent deacylase [Phycisphaerales bacterium]|nr:NAD-dependent deacylase [Phycisphaerales bacterium]